MDCSPPGSSVLGIFQARILGWIVSPAFAGGFFTCTVTWKTREPLLLELKPGNKLVPPNCKLPKFLFSRFGKGIMKNSINSPIINWKELDPNSTLAWKIPWTEEPRRLQSMGSLQVRHNWATSFSLFTFMHCRRKWQPTPVFLPGESQGQGRLVGCRLWGHTESDTTEVTQQQHQQL